MSVKKYLTLNGLTYFLNKIKAYLTSSTYLNSIGISNSDIDDIADDAGYSSGSLPASEDIFITGDIIPNTDNSVDLGASSKNIKMVYTKGITINGTQFLPSDYIPLSGTTAITGTGFFKSTSDGQLQIGSGTSTITGGCFVAYGSEYSNTDVAGAFRLRARTTSNYDLIGYANGSLEWSGPSFTSRNVYTESLNSYDKTSAIVFGTESSNQVFRPRGADNGKIALGTTGSRWKEVCSDAYYLGSTAFGDIVTHNATEFVPRSGGAVFTGTILAKTDTTGIFGLSGGTTRLDGGSVEVYGKDNSNYPGWVVIRPEDNNNYTQLILKPDGTATWGGNALLTSEIDSSGTSWVRFKSGIQICWGEDIHMASENTYTFPKTFKDTTYVVMVNGSRSASGTQYITSNNAYSIMSRTTTTFSINNGNGGIYILYLAIGMWK